MANTTSNYESYTVTELIGRIKELESAQITAEMKAKVSQELLVELQNKNNHLLRQLRSAEQEHSKQIAVLNNPDGRFSDRLSWLGKVVFVLRREGRPQRPVEIVEMLQELDDSLYSKANPSTFISVVLAKAVREKRLSLHKIFGTRGGYYALEEWLDDKGNLEDYIKEQLL